MNILDAHNALRRIKGGLNKVSEGLNGVSRGFKSDSMFGIKKNQVAAAEN